MACLGFMKQEIEQFVTVIYPDCCWKSINKSDLEISYRGKKKNPEFVNLGSFVYVAYENNHVLYVGETGKSIKRRFITDASGSHKAKNTDWYGRMTRVEYIKLPFEELPTKHRKLLEQAVSIKLIPEFYKYKD